MFGDLESFPYLCETIQARLTTMKRKKSDIQRFEDKIFYSPCGCWYWTSCVTKFGYGKFWYKGHVSAHRYSYQIYKAEVPANLFVLHSCDNRLCVNPHHLFLGTAQDNSNDMVKKGRSPKVLGSRNGMSKLSETSVRVIKEAIKIGFDYKSIAKYFGIKAGTICDIKRGRRWGHLI